MKTKLVFSLSLMMAFILLTTGCGQKQQQQMAAQEITVAHPEVRKIINYIEYPGYLTAEKTIEIVPRVDGFIEKINFQPGSRVSQGQTLYIIESKNYKDKQMQAQANLLSAQANLELTNTALKRMKEALKTNAVSELDVLQAQSNHDQAAAAVESAKANLELATTNLDYCYIKAPFAGRITTTSKDEGNIVNSITGGSTPLATLYKDDKLFVYFNIEDAIYNQMINSSLRQQKGTINSEEITILIGQPTFRTIQGKMDYLSPQVDLTTGTLQIRAMIDNKNGELKSGMYVRVQIPAKEISEAVLIPESSIGTDQTGKFVYVVNGSNQVEYRSIKIGALQSDDTREILSGLKAEDRFVTAALLKVRDGMTVEPVESKK